MRYAAELLDLYFQEGNEKMIVLLSDGANWVEGTEEQAQGEIVTTSVMILPFWLISCTLTVRSEYTRSLSVMRRL